MSAQWMSSRASKSGHRRPALVKRSVTAVWPVPLRVGVGSDLVGQPVDTLREAWKDPRELSAHRAEIGQ